MVSNDALHNSFELANSKLVPFLAPPIASLSLKPLPSSKFFLTLSLGSGGFSLASPGLKKSFPHELSVKRKTMHVSKILFDIDFNFPVATVKLDDYNIPEMYKSYYIIGRLVDIPKLSIVN